MKRPLQRFQKRPLQRFQKRPLQRLQKRPLQRFQLQCSELFFLSRQPDTIRQHIRQRICGLGFQVPLDIDLAQLLKPLWEVAPAVFFERKCQSIPFAREAHYRRG